MTDFPVQGVDISAWNGQMDFSITKQKCQYAFIRVGYNDAGKDSRCDFNRKAALDHDFPYGPYWYCKVGLDWRQHADNFARIAKEYPYQLDMVIDVEMTTLDPANTCDWLMKLDGRLEDLTGKRPMVYTSPGFWNSKVERNGYFRSNRLWVAHWTNHDCPILPNEWVKWVHWQWSADGNGKGREYGSIDGDPDMDLDRFYGTVDQFNALYGTHIIPIGDTPPVPGRVMVNVKSLNIRNAPVVSAETLLGYTTYGKIWEVEDAVKDEQGRVWYQVGQACYLAGWHCVPV